MKINNKSWRQQHKHGNKIMKKHSKNEFYVKAVRGGYFAIINGYDMSLESLETSRERADNECHRLNELRNARLNLM